MINPGTPKSPTIKAEIQLTATPKPINLRIVRTINPIKALTNTPISIFIDFPKTFKISKTIAKTIANARIL